MVVLQGQLPNYILVRLILKSIYILREFTNQQWEGSLKQSSA